MIEKITGNILEADVEALVNTVNCVGVMGKGIALQFKNAFPDMYENYRVACRNKQVVPGKMLIDVVVYNYYNKEFIIIINFPTKRHWKNPSIIGDIKSGLQSLITDIQAMKIKSIAIPPLGCGNGGLDWSVVCPMIEDAMEEVPDTKVLLYEPC